MSGRATAPGWLAAGLLAAGFLAAGFLAVLVAAGCQEDVQLLVEDAPDCQVCDGSACVPADDGTPCSIGMCAGGVCVSDACESGDRFAASAAGEDHTCAITPGGDLFCWGASDRAQLGTGTIDSDAVTLRPLAVPDQSDWTQLSSAWSHACGTRAGNIGACFGDNSTGQSATAPSAGVAPVVVVGGADEWSALTTGLDHSCGLGIAGDLWCWGDNQSGQLGVAGPAQSAAPVQVNATPPVIWRSASAGAEHTCAVAMNDGSLWCWGLNDHGSLGLGDDTEGVVAIPTQVPVAAQFTRVVAGGAQGCALDSGGTWRCWGDNERGQLGINSPEDEVESPIALPAPVRFEQIVMGDRHTCALDQGNGLWCWGDNESGQLGVGDRIQRSAPVQVGALTDWVHVSVGRRHTCAVRETGALLCWGENESGQLGLGDRTDRLAPSQVCPDP